MTDFNEKHQPQTTIETRRRATRCTRAQEKEVVNLLQTEVRLGTKIDRDAEVITVLDHKVTFTLRKITQDTYRFEGIPSLRSRKKRGGVEENMNRSYNDPASSRYYHREQDYSQEPYYPRSEQFERRQVAKKSTAQQAQVHQYERKRPAGPDFYRPEYNQQYGGPKRSRGSYEESDGRYRRNMSPPSSYNGVDSRRGSGSRYHEQDDYERRGPGRPPGRGRPVGRPVGRPKFNAKDDWNQPTRSSERSKTNNASTKAEPQRSQSQGPTTRGRPKLSQDSDGKPGTTKNPPKTNQTKSSQDKVGEAKPAAGRTSQPNGQIGSSGKATKSAANVVKPNSSGASSKPTRNAANVVKPNSGEASTKPSKNAANAVKPNSSEVSTKPSKSAANAVKPNSGEASSQPKVNEPSPAIKLKANARKSTYSPGKSKLTEQQGNSTAKDPSSVKKVSSESKSSPVPSKKPSGKNVVDEPRQTRASRSVNTEVRASALDNALRMEQLRKEEEAKREMEDQPVEKDNAAKDEEDGIDESNPDATKTASRKLMPKLSLARKISPTSARKSVRVSNDQNSESTESVMDAAQSPQKASAVAPKGSKQRMARKSAPKSSNQMGVKPDNSLTKSSTKGVEKEFEKGKLCEKTASDDKMNTEPAALSTASVNGPVPDKPFGPRPTENKKLETLSMSKKTSTGPSQKPSTKSCDLPSAETLEATPAESLTDENMSSGECSPPNTPDSPLQSARTIPFKPQLQSKKKATVVKPSVQPTARKSAPSSEQSKKPETRTTRPEIRVPVQSRPIKDDDFTLKPMSIIPAVRIPVAESKIISNEVKVDGVLDVKDKPKDNHLKTLNRSLFHTAKLKNILGKASAKIEAKNTPGEASLDDTVSDKKLQLMDKMHIKKDIAEVKEQLREMIKVDITNDKLQVGSTDIETKNITKSEEETKLEIKSLSVKQETKQNIALDVPEIPAKIEEKTTKVEASTVPNEDTGINHISMTSDTKKVNTLVSSASTTKPSNIVSTDKKSSSKPDSPVKANLETNADKKHVEPKVKEDTVKSSTMSSTDTISAATVPAKSSSISSTDKDVPKSVSTAKVPVKSSMSSTDKDVPKTTSAAKVSLETKPSTDDDTAKTLTSQKEDQHVKEATPVQQESIKPSSEKLEKVEDNNKVVVLEKDSTLKEGSNSGEASSSKPTVNIVASEEKSMNATANRNVEPVVASKTPDNKDINLEGGKLELTDMSNTGDGKENVLTDSTVLPSPKPNVTIPGSKPKSATTIEESTKSTNTKSVDTSPDITKGKTNEQTKVAIEPEKISTGPSDDQTILTKEGSKPSNVIVTKNLALSTTAVLPSETPKSTQEEDTSSASVMEVVDTQTKPTNADDKTKAANDVSIPITSKVKARASTATVSTARKNKDTDSADDALLLNSSTNDSAEEPMEVDGDGDSEMDDYLLQEDEAPQIDDVRDKVADPPVTNAGLDESVGKTDNNTATETSVVDTATVTSNVDISQGTVTLPASTVQSKPTVAADTSQKSDSEKTETSVSETTEHSATVTKPVAPVNDNIEVESASATDVIAPIANNADVPSTKIGDEAQKDPSPDKSAFMEAVKLASAVPSTPEKDKLLPKSAECNDTPVAKESSQLNVPSSDSLSTNSSTKAPPTSTSTTSTASTTAATTLPSLDTEKPVTQPSTNILSSILTKQTSAMTPSDRTSSPKASEDLSSKSSSRSATPSDKVASGVDIIELSSDEDGNNASSSAKPKTKKRKLTSKSSSDSLTGGKSGKRSVSPLTTDVKENKKAKIDAAGKELPVLSQNLSKQDLVAKIIEHKMRQHVKHVNELANRAKALEKQLAAVESSRQKWQMESTRLQIKVHELNEQNDILISKRKEVPSKVIVTAGTQYDRQDVLQAQQLLAAHKLRENAAKQHSQNAKGAQAPMSNQRAPHTPNAQTPVLNRSVASDANRSTNPTVTRTSDAAPQRQANAPQRPAMNPAASRPTNGMARTTNTPTRPTNAPQTSASAGGASGAKAPSTPGNVHQSSQRYQFGIQQQSQPVNLHHQHTATHPMTPVAPSTGIYNSDASNISTCTSINVSPGLELKTLPKSPANSTKNVYVQPHSSSEVIQASVCDLKSSNIDSESSPKHKTSVQTVTTASLSSEDECNEKETNVSSVVKVSGEKVIDDAVSLKSSDAESESDDMKLSPISISSTEDEFGEVECHNDATEIAAKDVAKRTAKDTAKVTAKETKKSDNDTSDIKISRKQSMLNNCINNSSYATTRRSVTRKPNAKRLWIRPDVSQLENGISNRNQKSNECVCDTAVDEQVSHQIVKPKDAQSKAPFVTTNSSELSVSRDLDASNIDVHRRTPKPKDSWSKSFDASHEGVAKESSIGCSKQSSKCRNLADGSVDKNCAAKMNMDRILIGCLVSSISSQPQGKPSDLVIDANNLNSITNITWSKALNSAVGVASRVQDTNELQSVSLNATDGAKGDGSISSDVDMKKIPVESNNQRRIPADVAAAIAGNQSPASSKVSETGSRSGVPTSKPSNVPTAKPGDVRAKSSASRRPSDGQASGRGGGDDVTLIDLTDDDDAAAAAASKNRVPPLNPVRTPPVQQPTRVPQQNAAHSKTPPVAHRATPPRTMPQSPTVPNILTRKPTAGGQPQQQAQNMSASNKLQELRRQQMIQSGQQAQQQVQVVHTSQARVSPMQQTIQQQQQTAHRTMQQATVTTQGGQRQVVNLPSTPNAARVAVSSASRAPAPQMLQTVQQQQVVQQQVVQQQVVQQQAPVGQQQIIRQQAPIQQQIIQRQVVPPGQVAQIIQTPTGQVVMTSVSSGMTTVLAAQPIQAGPGGQLTYQIQAVPGQPLQQVTGQTVQQMLIQQQQQQQQHNAQVVQQQQVSNRFATPTNTVQPSNMQQQLTQAYFQGGHVVHHRGDASSRPPPLVNRAPVRPSNPPQAAQPPPYRQQQQQRRPSYSDAGAVRTVTAPAVTSVSASSAVDQTQAQIMQYEALAQNMQQTIQKLKEEDAPFEKRRIEILKELQIGSLDTYRTQDLHMQLRHIQNEQSRIQTESKAKVNHLQQYLQSKHQLQQSLQQLQRQQVVQQNHQQQQQVTLQQQVQQQRQQAQVSASNRATITQIPATVAPTSQSNPSRRHPAPLPIVPSSAYTVNSNADPPPKPSLSISKVNQGIVLSWNMSLNTAVHAAIDFYNLYAYQETDAPANTSLWKKIGEVKALPLPMACTLTQFQPGSMYHFAVCAIDVYHRTGPFSDASSINLPAL